MSLNPDWTELRRELIAMAEQDLEMRAELASDGALFQGYHSRMQAVQAAAGRRQVHPLQPVMLEDRARLEASRGGPCRPAEGAGAGAGAAPGRLGGTSAGDGGLASRGGLARLINQLDCSRVTTRKVCP
jgi:hypothetical protein